MSVGTKNGLRMATFFICHLVPFVCEIAPYIEPIVGKKIPSVGIQKNSGFTLTELLITLIIAGILLGISVPSLVSFVRSNRLISVTNDFITDISFARSEALKRSAVAGVCSGGSCGSGASWNTGWIVFADLDDSGAWTASDTILRARDAAPPEMAVTGSDVTIIYNRQGLATTGTGNYTFCNTALGKSKTVEVMAGGRHRLVDGGC